MLSAYLLLAAAMFTIGLFGVLTRRNAVGILLGLELMLNAVNITILAFARFSEGARPVAGATFVVFVLTVAAAEAAVALALAVSVYRNRESVSVDAMTLLKN